MNTVKFVIEILVIIAGIIAITYFAEKMIAKANGEKMSVITTRVITVTGLFSALGMVLMIVDFPVPFAPPFYKLDVSELPVLILTFAYGPVTGVITELLKVLLKLLFKPTSTAFVGEFANFVVGCSFIVPAGLIYKHKKTKTQAIWACVIGTLLMTITGAVFNGAYLLPKFAEIYGMPLEAIIEMGTKINPDIISVERMAILAVAPLNLLKGTIVSVITILLYKRMSPIIKGQQEKQ